MITVHMLWVRGALTNLAAMSIRSFVRAGFRVTVWSYDMDIRLPAGATWANARVVLPASRIFVVQQSYAPFSDLFRYAVLSRCGGMWADTDVIAVQSATAFNNRRFLVQERTSDGSSAICGCLINAVDAEDPFIELALAVANTYPVKDVQWLELGQPLLTALLGLYKSHGYVVYAPEFACPINYWECPSALLTVTGVPPSPFVHLYNARWSAADVSRDVQPPAGSVLDQLYRTAVGLANSRI